MLANWNAREKGIALTVVLVMAVFAALVLLNTGSSDDEAKEREEAVRQSPVREILGEWRAKISGSPDEVDPLKFTIYVDGRVRPREPGNILCDGTVKKVPDSERHYKISECVTYVNAVEGGEDIFADAQLSPDGKTLTITTDDSQGHYVRD
ncbi:hypothetical protein ACFYR1_49865 [Streptomyces canus]|uniref:hypothetical protein n=1 Tax=Streptomyces canus TaxID=58343 RepID=UPI00369D02BD